MRRADAAERLGGQRSLSVHRSFSGCRSIFPKTRRPLSVVAAISVTQDGVVIGQIKFVLQIKRTASFPDDLKVVSKATSYETAFISYASQNRPEVPRYVQMLRLVGISYFQDLISLDPGPRWAQQLYTHIGNSSTEGNG